MKRWKLFSTLLLSGLCALSRPWAIYGADTCISYSGSNYSRQNYTDYSKIPNSYLTSCDDGRIMRVQNGLASGPDPGIQIEYYDTLYNLLDSKTIPSELPIFGGFYETQDSYFILSGQSNTAESNTVECFRITKYTKSWTKVSSCSLKDCNTTYPFMYGSADFAHEGDYLIVRTCHEMYANEDGSHDQATLAIQINMKTMTVTDSMTDRKNYREGYASNSLNQFVHIEDGHMIALEHGNAYPRSAALFQYKTNITAGTFVPAQNNLCTVVDMLPFPENPDNSLVTGASIGGFEISDSAYLVAGNSIDQTNINFSNNTRNIWIASAAKNTDGTIGSPVVKWLTSYKEGEENPTTPHLVKISNQRFALLWEEGTQVCYAVIDGEGNQIGSTYQMNGNLSDCAPAVIHNNIIWYTWKDNTTTFYEISCDDFSQNAATAVEREGHHYEIVPGTLDYDTGYADLACSLCDAESYTYIPLEWTSTWNTQETGAYEDTHAPSFDVNENLYLKLEVIPEYKPRNKFNIIVADPNILTADISGSLITIHMLKAGTTTITVQAAYKPDISQTYSITVAHDFTTTITKPATCSQEGEQQSQCKKCGYRETTKIPKTEHSYGKWTIVQEATCYQEELQKSTCSICQQTIQKKTKDKLEHQYQHSVTSPTCTEGGYTTYTCSTCHTSYKDNETEPLGHNITNYVITTESTCTQHGEKTGTCSRCSQTASEALPLAPHSYKDTVVPPTCTQEGYTEHTCVNCNTTIKDTTTAKLPHQFTEFTITKESTCTQQGEKTGYCSSCNQTVTELLPLAEHQYQDTVIPSTCTEKGYTLHTCIYCKTTKKDTYTEPLGHNVSNYTTAKEPTCTQEGEKIGTCSRCGLQDTVTLPSLGHDYQNTVIAPTCTQEGYTVHTCTRCGNEITDSYTQKLPHNFTNYTITKNATCTENGEKTGTCNDCQTKDVQIISKIPHSYVNKTVKPTYGAPGYTLYSCKLCGASYKTNYKAKLTISIPSGLRMNKNSTKTVSLTWNPVVGISGYAIFQYKGGAWKLIARTSSNRYTAAKLSPGKSYQFRIRAYKLENKLFYYSNFSKLTVASTKPKTVKLKNPKSPKKKTVKVSWKKAACKGYEVQLSTTKNFKKIQKKTSVKKSKTTTFTFKKLKRKKSYFVRIRCYIMIGKTKYYSDFSKPKRVKCK